jgi:hypothetical protein
MSRHMQEQFVASLEQMQGSSGPSDTDVPASVAPTVMEAVDEETEEVAIELDATKEPLGGDTSAEKAAT